MSRRFCSEPRPIIGSTRDFAVEHIGEVGGDADIGSVGAAGDDADRTRIGAAGGGGQRCLGAGNASDIQEIFRRMLHIWLFETQEDPLVQKPPGPFL